MAIAFDRTVVPPQPVAKRYTAIPPPVIARPAIAVALAKKYKILYIPPMAVTAKPIAFLGSAQEDLRAFPIAARREAGYQLDRVQNGHEPNDWKPLPRVGAGVREIRIREADGAFRVIYVAKLADAIYVLHCFQKKSQTTSKADLEIAAKRYRLAKELDDG